MGDGGKGSGRKSKNRADDTLMGRLRGAAQKNDPAPKSIAKNARDAFKGSK